MRFDPPLYALQLFRSFQARVPETRAEIGNLNWPRQELLELADLLSRLDVRDIEHEAK